MADKRFRFTLTSLSNPRRCIGFARRRVGRGGRIIFDRVSTNYDDFWRTLDFSIIDSGNTQEKKDALEAASAEPGSSNGIQTDIKSEFSVSRVNRGSVRTSESAGSGSGSDVKVEIKVEPLDVQEEGVTPLEPVHTKEDKDDMVDFLRSLRRDWYVTILII